MLVTWDVTNIPNLSLTYDRHDGSPRLVTNICHQQRCNRTEVIETKIVQVCLKYLTISCNLDPVSDIIVVLNIVPAKWFLNKHEWESKSYVQHFYIWDYVRHWTRNDHVCSPKSDLTFNLPFSALTDSNSPTAFN